MRNIILLLCLIIGGKVFADSPLIYIDSSPASNSTITSFDEVLLNFDFSNVIATYGENEEWGVCHAGSDYDPALPEYPEQSIKIYKGTPENGELLIRGYNDVQKPNKSGFNIGQSFKISFPDVEVESGVNYTMIINTDFYAGISGEKKYKKDTELRLVDTPIVLSFTGAGETKKHLTLDSYSHQYGVVSEKLGEVSLTFNYDINVSPNAQIYVIEGEDIITTSTSINVDSSNSQSIIVSFPEQELYYGHVYRVIVPNGTVSVKDDINIVNTELTIQIEGASFRTFGTGRVRPSDGSTTVMGEITIPFKFPEAEGSNYGFVAMDNGDQTPFTAYLYLGRDFEAEPIETLIGEVTSDMKGLIFRPTIVPEPETEYTLVIPEGNVKAYEIGAAHNAYLKDYISERVELHYTTPSVASLPLWQPSAVSVSEGDELEHVDYFIVNCPDYEYDGTIYNTISAKLGREGGKLYEVTADGDKEVASFNITRPTLTAESEIGNGQYIGRHFVGKVDKDLYAGKTYKLVLLYGEFVVDNPFIGHYVGNEEVSVTIHGAASTELKSEFTSNIAEGQTTSHLGVVSIYTNDPVAVVEGAALELRNGENVKTALVRVATEEGYSHIYADFSDADHKALALDRATEYTVVLPQGSLTHAENENLVNNEYSFSVNGLEKEVEPIVPEYVSVDFMIDNYASASYRMVKGEPSTIKVNASDEWYLKSLTLNGEDVIENVSEDGFYTLPALDADAELAAEFSYFEDLEMTEVSGIGSIENGNRNVSVYNDGSVIVIENLEDGDNVAVYTVNGMVIKSFVASKDIMYIDAPVDQVYIIRVNNGAVKLQH